MNAQNSIETKIKEMPKGMLGGVILIALGVLFLIGQFVHFEWYGQFILTALAALFLVGGLATRRPGLIVPGGILGGIALGVWAQGLPMFEAETNSASIFLFCFAAGWALITALTFALGKVMWWPLIPGGIMALIGAALLTGGPALAALEMFGKYGWPLILIAISVYVIFRRRNSWSDDHREGTKAQRVFVPSCPCAPIME